ncbi:MAG TPA: hypothetical protein VK154_00415 [Chitinophagales bacterium]|nr:hypothetical protein [Chitinophagales bacterium]
MDKEEYYIVVKTNPDSSREYLTEAMDVEDFEEGVVVDPNYKGSMLYGWTKKPDKDCLLLKETAASMTAYFNTENIQMEPAFGAGEAPRHG